MRARQSGFTLIELSIAAVIISIMALSFAKWESEQRRAEGGRAFADHAITVNNAVQQYVLRHYDNLNTVAPAVTGFLNPLAPTMAELQTAKILPAGVSTSTSNGGSFLVQVSKVPAGCTPPACDISTLVSVTLPVINQKQSTPDLSFLGAAARRVGANGGYSSATAALIEGTDGAWTAANPAGAVAGIFAIRGGYGTSGFDQFLRADGSKPIVKVVAAGDACAGNGLFGIDASGRFLTCQGGVYAIQGSQYWKDPVATFSALPAAGNIAGEVRQTLDNGRLFTWKGGAWTPIAIDQNGDITVPGGMSAATSAVTGRSTTDDLLVNRTIVANTACSPNGLLARDADSVYYSCQAGFWKKAAGIPAGPGSLKGVLESLDGRQFYVYINGYYTGYVKFSALNGLYVSAYNAGYTIPDYLTVDSTHSYVNDWGYLFAGLSYENSYYHWGAGTQVGLCSNGLFFAPSRGARFSAKNTLPVCSASPGANVDQLIANTTGNLYLTLPVYQAAPPPDNGGSCCM